MAAPSNLESSAIWGDTEGVDAELAMLTPEEIRQRTTMLNNNMRVLKSDLNSVDTEVKYDSFRCGFAACAGVSIFLYTLAGCFFGCPIIIACGATHSYSQDADCSNKGKRGEN